jgi:hypothetical protein
MSYNILSYPSKHVHIPLGRGCSNFGKDWMHGGRGRDGLRCWLQLFLGNLLFRLSVNFVIWRLCRLKSNDGTRDWLGNSAQGKLRASCCRCTEPGCPLGIVKAVAQRCSNRRTISMLEQTNSRSWGCVPQHGGRVVERGIAETTQVRGRGEMVRRLSISRGHHVGPQIALQLLMLWNESSKARYVRR